MLSECASPHVGTDERKAGGIIDYAAQEALSHADDAGLIRPGITITHTTPFTGAASSIYYRFAAMMPRAACYISRAILFLAPMRGLIIFDAILMLIRGYG